LLGFAEPFAQLLSISFFDDEAPLEIISVVVSTNDVSDAEALPDLLQDAPGGIEQVSADGGSGAKIL
jgi:hypothetical protein